MSPKPRLLKKIFKNPLGDFTGGLMAAVIALPLCLAFGVASGLGAPAGLYGAIACGIFAALFGGTRGQCSGPTGPMTVVAATIYSTTPHRPELVFAACIAAGLIQIVLGFAKSGRLIHYMPYPVISGFMTGIGVIIVCIELGPLIGIRGEGNVIEALQSLFIPNLVLNTSAAILSALTIALIYLLPLFSKRLPASLIALVIATWTSITLNMDVPRIGDIPSQLPMPKFPDLKITDLHLVLQSGLTLAFLGAIDSLLTSLVLEKVTGKRHNSDRELMGQGLGNIFAGLIGGIPGAGATMRSMVNIKSGGTTNLSGFIHGLILLLVLLFLGKAASQIPLATLAAILFTVGLSIMDWRVLKGLRKTPKSDACVMLVVLFLTIFVDLIVAVLTGVALASVLFVKKLTDAKISSISSLDSLENLHEIAEHIPENVRKNTYSYVLNGSLFFGEAKNLTETIDKLADAEYIILRFANVPFIDQTGAFALETAIEKWSAKGTKVMFVAIPEHVKKTLEDLGLRIDLENSFDRFEKALAAINDMESKKEKNTAGEK